jgi:carbon monoxide dehydrogenase subunit G
MGSRSIQVETHIDNTPEAVISYIADVRNRTNYLTMLKSVSDIQGDPSAAGTTWKWEWSAFGLEFHGTGRCLEHEPGRHYRMQSEGDIRSTWTYRAQPEGEGTKLTVDLDYEVPERAIPFLPLDAAGEAVRRAAIDRALQKLKEILDR